MLAKAVGFDPMPALKEAWKAVETRADVPAARAAVGAYLPKEYAPGPESQSVYVLEVRRRASG